MSKATPIIKINEKSHIKGDESINQSRKTNPRHPWRFTLNTFSFSEISGYERICAVAIIG